MDEGRRTDLAAGLFYIVLGLFFALGATSYHFGTALRPGAGYFPFGLGALLATIGLVLAIQAILSRPQAAVAPVQIKLRPLIATLVAVLMFALLARVAGMLLSVLAVVVVSSLASDIIRLKQSIILGIFMMVSTWLIFSVGIGIPISVLPPILGR